MIAVSGSPCHPINHHETHSDSDFNHPVSGSGALKAPDLTGVAQRLDEQMLRAWLENRQAIKPNTAMPNLRLSDAAIDAIIAYLKTL